MNRFVLSVSRCLMSASLVACLATGSQAQQGQQGQSPSGPTSVKVINTPLPIEDVDNAARQPFVASCFINALSQPAGSPSCSLGTVPSGKVLVIETVAGTFQIATIAVLRSVNLEVAGVGVTSATYPLTVLPMPLSTQPGNNGLTFTAFTVTQPLLAYVVAGGQMQVMMPSANTIFVFGSFTVSGHLVSN